MSDARTPVEIFCSYAHRDEALRDELDAHLAVLRVEGRISHWHDRKIMPGQDWAKEIDAHLESAEIILLLVSHRFFNSGYCVGIEMKRALERHKAGEAHVIPILLRDVDWEKTELAVLQALPVGGRPITRWRDRHSAFADVVRGIRVVLDSLAGESPPPPNPLPLARERGSLGGAAPSLPAIGVEHPVGLITNVAGHHGYFTGRDTILGQVHAALAKGKGRDRVQVLHGLSGVGKSRLAIEYMHRYGHEYRLAWRLRATEPTRIADDFAEMAGPLGLPVADPTDLPAIRDAVSRWLAEHDEWLLVFDDASKPEDIIPHLPTEVRGHVLVTSLNPAWRRIGTPRRVYHLNRDASITFLLDQTGLDDVEGAGKVADLLGGLPLALSQAAAYIEARTDFAGYVRLFERRRKALWKHEEAPEDHDRRSVEVSFRLALSQVEKARRAAVDLLRLCAFFAPDDIPIWLIREGAEYLPKALRVLVKDEMAWNEAVGMLTRYSLIDVGNGGISVHNLVQVVVRDSLSEAGQRRWAGTAVKLMRATFPEESGDVQTWDRCAPLLAHALAAVDHAEVLGSELDSASYILDRSANYLQGRAQLMDARFYFERALRIDESAYGPDHTDVASALNNLGRVLHDLGDLTGARAHYERALRISESAVGSDHPMVATEVNNLGLVLGDMGDLEGARAHLERALRTDEAAYGPTHPTVALRVSNLGSVLHDQGDFAGARAHFERALRILERAYGPNHQSVAISLNNLGSALWKLGDLVEARSLYERALRIDAVAYGPDHPTVALRVNNLGTVLLDLGDHEEARVCFEQALRIAEMAYGLDHPKTRLYGENLRALGAGDGLGG